jgi:hypothetical protein
MPGQQQLQKPTRTLFGNVTGPETKSGDGYQVIHESTGIYTVAFNQPYPSPPTVVVTQLHPNKFGEADEKEADPKDNAVVIGIEEARFKTLTGDKTGQKADRGFGFIAVGPA